MIHLHRRVYECKNCSHLFTETNPISKEGKTISLQFDIEILNALIDKTNSYTKVAEIFDVSPTYVQELFDCKVSINRQNMPTVLCIDEIYSEGLTPTKYYCVLYAPQWNKIVDVLDSRSKDNLIDFFARVPISEKNRVKFFFMDLWDNYRQMTKLCLPNAIICADSFHVIKKP